MEFRGWSLIDRILPIDEWDPGDKAEMESMLEKAAVRAEDIVAITKNKKKAQTDLANHEIVTLATYLAGGRSNYADTEDIAKMRWQ